MTSDAVSTKGHVALTIYADGYLVEVFAPKGDSPVREIPCGNNRRYFGSPIHPVPVGHEDALSPDELLDAARRHAERIALEHLIPVDMVSERFLGDSSRFAGDHSGFQSQPYSA